MKRLTMIKLTTSQKLKLQIPFKCVECLYGNKANIAVEFLALIGPPRCKECESVMVVDMDRKIHYKGRKV